MLSENDGMGVPSRPVIMMRYRSRAVSPHMGRAPSVKLKGGMGRLRSSVRVGAEGPFALPVTPWHFQHSTRANTSPPVLTLSGVISGAAGIFIAGRGFSVCQRGD